MDPELDINDPSTNLMVQNTISETGNSENVNTGSGNSGNESTGSGHSGKEGSGNSGNEKTGSGCAVFEKYDLALKTGSKEITITTKEFEEFAEELIASSLKMMSEHEPFVKLVSTKVFKEKLKIYKK